MSNDKSKADAVKLAERDAEVISKGIDDIGDLVADNDIDTCIKVICIQANAIKFNGSLNKAGRKRAMLNLRNGGINFPLLSIILYYTTIVLKNSEEQCEACRFCLLLCRATIIAITCECVRNIYINLY